MAAINYGYGYQNPYNTKTIQEYINCKSNNNMTHFNSSFINIDKNIMYSVHNVVSDYIDEIRENYCMEIELSNKEFEKYKYKPKLLCYDIYGTTEVSFIILLINDMSTPKQFNRQRILMPTKENMNELCSRILNSNKEAIKYYDKNNT